jgi:hypothetical protein
MQLTSKLVGIVCVMLTIVLWAVTIVTDLTPGSVAAASALSAIVAMMIVFTSTG